MSLIPSLVDSGHLVQANSFILASNQIMMAISYTAGGWLILSLPLHRIAFAVIGLFVLATFIAMPIAEPKREKIKDDDRRESIWTSWVSGWKYLRKHPIARPLTVMETVEHLPHGIWTGALMLAFTTKALHGDAVDWGYQATGYFTGMILGSLGALTISDWLARYSGRIIVINACAAGLLTLAYAGSQTVWIAVMWAFVFGPPFAIRDVAQDSLLQSTVEKGQLGRIYATREMLRNAVFMFAGVFFAWASDFISIRTIYVIGGVLYLMTGLYALSNKALRDSKIIPAKE
jgi:MFS family permease